MATLNCTLVYLLLGLVTDYSDINADINSCFFQLMLKHRQNKNQKMRIIAFIASPVDNDTKDVRNL